MSIRRRILDKGKIVKKVLLDVLTEHEERISALEDGGAEGSGYDDTELKASIKALEDEIGADNKAGTLKGRIKALEDA